MGHETSEAILATIEEQKIDLVIIDFETYRNNRVLFTRFSICHLRLTYHLIRQFYIFKTLLVVLSDRCKIMAKFGGCG